MGFVFLRPFAFMNLPVTSGQAAKTGAESRKRLTKSLTYQEITVKMELCVIQGELGGPGAWDRGGSLLGRVASPPPRPAGRWGGGVSSAPLLGLC